MSEQLQYELPEQHVRTDHHPEFSRRSLLGQAVLASACGIVGFSKHLTAKAVFADEKPSIVSPATPEEALKYLYSGNSRFASGKSEANRDMNRVRAVAREQKPFAAFLGCADSRVPIEIVFDQGFGDLFVTRIAGNVASSENIGSLEFGTQVLGAKVLYVLGHTECGAVNVRTLHRRVHGTAFCMTEHVQHFCPKNLCAEFQTSDVLT